MNFKQRLRLFLTGFIPGCIILAFIINKKGCTSPNELKMLEIQYQTLQLGNKALCKIKCLKQNETLFKLALKKFEVNYSLSDVHKKPYGTFYLQAIDPKDALYEMVVEDKDTITFINDIKLITKIENCNCDTVQ